MLCATAASTVWGGEEAVSQAVALAFTARPAIARASVVSGRRLNGRLSFGAAILAEFKEGRANARRPVSPPSALRAFRKGKKGSAPVRWRL